MLELHKCDESKISIVRMARKQPRNRNKNHCPDERRRKAANHASRADSELGENPCTHERGIRPQINVCEAAESAPVLCVPDERARDWVNNDQREERTTELHQVHPVRPDLA